MTKRLISLLLILSVALSLSARTFQMERYGIKPNSGKNLSSAMAKALTRIKKQAANDATITLVFKPGRYDFHPQGSTQREYYISNHDQNNPKNVGIALEDFNNLTIEGNGAQLIFHGQMLPISMLRSKNCAINNISIDFENPHIAQCTIVKNEGDKGITFRPAPWVKYRITENESMFETYGEGWALRQMSGIAFEPDSRHIVYNTADLFYHTKGCKEVAPGEIYAPKWVDKRLPEGTVVAMRTWHRPTPGIFLSHNTDTKLHNVKVHYAQGMGLLAQLCTNIEMEGFSVCLKGDDDPRYFTTQADATHFSQCKGKIISNNGLYEGMMDDAINVHGTYLKIVKRIDNHTLVGKYMHGQAWGFDWGYQGDSVQFVRTRTMEHLDSINTIASITPVDKPTAHGAKEFKITFTKPLPDEVTVEGSYGIENLTWTPEVIFAGNTIRNNRARGSLFSTPRNTLVTNNIFDHTSGSAILLCGDCNGWYETGACRNVTISHNKFINSLTNMFQFTNAVISIYPEIPELNKQVKYFHGGKRGAIKIIHNEFQIFDAPVLYAKSVDGLLFKHNTITTNTDYKPFHWNKSRFLLERVTNAQIE